MKKPILDFKIVSELKNKLVYRTFWGRGSLYKQIVHISIISLSILLVVTGISNRISLATSSKDLETNFYDIYARGSSDLLTQGGSIQTVLTSTPGVYFKVIEHKVKDGDTLDTLASDYKVSRDTIKWANQSKIDYYSEKLKLGDVLQIPEVNGVLYEVKDGETLESILSKTSGDKFQVVELNQLPYPDFKVVAGSKLLIPDGKLAPPPPPAPSIPQPSYYISPTNVGESLVSGGEGSIRGIRTLNPLSNPSCGGYIISRGFLPWHNGLDLARWPGCPIRAIADGVVSYAGWGFYGEGYYVRIDHGNNIQSVYYHGDGNIWVKGGDQVTAGQEIMNMGTTGNSTGVHLHLGLKVDGVYIDPAPYVPY